MESPRLPSLAGRVALVTGGSRGIGAAIAVALAEAGADVAIGYNRSASEASAVLERVRATGARGAVLAVDHAAVGAGADLVTAVEAHFGHLDILVVNAGVSVWSPLGSAPDDAELARQVQVNYLGAVETIEAALRVMPRGGRVVCVGSTAAHQPGIRGLAHYAGTKAALVGFSRGAARDVAERGITVNVVQPGHIDTSMNPESARDEGAGPSIPVGRFGRPEEVAAAVVFLAGPAASYITGAVLDVDGGVSL